MSDAKHWWTSKTAWASILTVLIGLFGWLAGNEIIAEHPSAVAAFTVVVGALNFALRLVTNKPVQWPAVLETVRQLAALSRKLDKGD